MYVTLGAQAITLEFYMDEPIITAKGSKDLGPSGQKRLFLMPGKSAEFTISKGEFMSFGPFPGYEKDPYVLIQQK